MPPPTSRNYVCTYNNPPADWDPALIFQRPEFRYGIGQYERGKETRLLHFQGYVVFRAPIRLAAAKLSLHAPTAHLEIRRGTHDEANSYCSKSDTRDAGYLPVQVGQPPPGSGARTDWVLVKQTLDDGRGLRAVAEENFGLFIRSYRGLERYLALVADPRNAAPSVYYYWGPAGSGKTKAVYDEFPNPAELYSAPVPPTGGTPWFDGYVNGEHAAILLDDYYHGYRLTFFLQLLDRYPMRLPVKGGFTILGNVDFYITSNIPLEEQYPNAPDQNAIRRRFTQVKHFDSL